MRGRPALWAASGALAIAFSGILVRLADVEPATAAFFRCLYALPFLLPLAIRERRRYGSRAPGQRRLAWLAGLFFAVDLELWHHSIAAVGAGLSTVIANTQVVIVPLTAWAVLRERPTGRQAAAVPVVLTGVVLISGVLGAKAYGDDPLLGALFALGTALAYSGFLLVLRAGIRDVRRPATALFDATAASAAAVLAIGLVLGEIDPLPGWEAQGWLWLLAFSAQFAGWLLISASLPRLRAAATSIVLTLQPVCTVLLGMALLDEEPSAVQLTGVAVVVAGIALAAGRRPRPATSADFP